jgi:hypothetical protein
MPSSAESFVSSATAGNGEEPMAEALEPGRVMTASMVQRENFFLHKMMCW